MIMVTVEVKYAQSSMYFCILVGIFLTNLKKTYQYHRKSLENYYNYLNINATINICESNK